MPERPAAAAVTPGIGHPVPLPEVVMGEEIKLSDTEVAPLWNGTGRVVGAFFPLDRAEIEVVQSAFKAGAGNPRAYSLVGHGGDGGFWVQRRSDRQMVKLNEAGVWRLLNSLLVPDGGAWPAMSDVMIVSCGVNNPATGGLLGKIQKLTTTTDYPGELSGTEGRARLRKDNPWIEELGDEPPGPLTVGVSTDENGVPYVDLATPPRSDRTFPVFPLTEADSTEPLRKVQRRPPRREVAVWTGLFSKEDPSKLHESNEEGLSAFARLFAANVKVLAEQGREMPEVRLRASATSKWKRVLAPKQIGLLERCLLDAVRRHELDPGELGITFDHDLDYSNNFGDLSIFVLDSPNLPPQSYRAALELDLPVNLKKGAVALSAADIRRLRWMIDGLVERVDVSESTVLVMRFIVGPKGLGNELKSLITTEVNEVIRAAKSAAREADIGNFIKNHIVFRVLVNPGNKAKLALDIIGPFHDLDGFRREPLSLSWNNGALIEVPAIESTIQLERLRMPVWKESSGRSVEIGTLAEWFGALSLHEEQELIAQASLDELGGFVDVVARNMKMLAEHGRETADIRLSQNLAEEAREAFGPGLLELVENELRRGLKLRGIDSQAFGLCFDYSESRIAKHAQGFKIAVHKSPNRSPQSYRSARSLELELLWYGGLPEAHRRRLYWMVQGFVERVRGNFEQGKGGRLVVDLRSRFQKMTFHTDQVTREVIAAVRMALPREPDTNIKDFIRDHIVLVRRRTSGEPGLFLDVQAPSHALDSVEAEPDLSLSWNTQELVPSPGPVVEPPDQLSWAGRDEDQPGDMELIRAYTTVLDEDSGPRDSAAPTGVDAGGVGLPVPLPEVVGEIGLDEVVFVPLTYADGEVGTFFPLVEAEVGVVRSAFAAGAYSGSYSLVAHGRGDGFWVRRKSGGVVRLNASGVWRLLSSLLQPGMWPVLPKVMIVSCWVDNPARGGFLGQIRQFARNADYPETLSGSQKRARIRQGNPWVEELDGEPSEPVKGGVSFDEKGVPYVDLARPRRSNPTFPVFPLTTTEGPGPTREIQKVLPNRKVVGGWSGPVSEDDPSSLLESNRKGLSAFADLFAANVKVLAGQNREMPDVRLNASVATARIKAQGPGQFGLLWGYLLNAVGKEGLDADTLGLAFESHYLHMRSSDGFGISVMDSPNLSIQSYRATRVLTLLFKMTSANGGALYDVGIRRLRWMMEGLVRRVDADESAVLVMRLVVHREKQGAGLMSSITFQVNKAVRHAKPEAQDGDIEKFIKKHIVFRVIVDPGCKTQLALDIVGPAHELDGVPREPLSLSWKNVDVGEGSTSESIIKFKLLTAPVWEDSSGRSVEIGTVTEWSAELSRLQAQWPQPIAQAGLGELDGFLDVVAHNMKVLAEQGRETLDIRLTLSLVEGARAEFGPRLRQWLENTLWLGLESRWGDARASGLRFDYSERPEGANNPPGFKITVHRSPNWSPGSYQAARRLELQVLRPARLPEAHRRRLRWMVQGLVKRVRENSDPEWNVRLVVDLRSSDAQPMVLTKGVTREVIAAVREALPGQPEQNIRNFIRDHIVLFRQSYRRGKQPELFLDIEGPPHDELDSARVDPDLPLSWNRQELVPLLSGRVAEPLDPLSPGEDVNLFSAFTRVLDEESGPRDSATQSAVDLGDVRVPVPLPEVVGEIGLDEVVFVPLTYADRETGTFFPLKQAEVEVVQSAFAAGASSGSYSLVAHGTGDEIWVRRKSGGVVRLNASGVWRLLSSLLHPGMWPVLPKVMIVSCWVDNPARGGFLGQIRQFARNADYPETLSGSQKRARIRQGNPWVEELDGEPSGPVKGGVGFDEHGIPYVDMTPPPRSNPTFPVFPLTTTEGPEPTREIQKVLPYRKVVGGWSGPVSEDDPSSLLESNKKRLSAFAKLFAANVKVLAGQNREMPDVQLNASAATAWIKAKASGQFGLLWGCLLNAVRKEGLDPDALGLTFESNHLPKRISDGFGIAVLDSPNLPTQSYRAARVLTLLFKMTGGNFGALYDVGIRRLRWMMEGLVQRVDADKSTLLVMRLVVHREKQGAGLISSITLQVNKAVRHAKPEAQDGDIKDFIKKHIVFRVIVDPSCKTQLALDIVGPDHELDRVPRENPFSLSWRNLDVGEVPSIESIIKFKRLSAPVWQDASGRSVEIGTLTEWFSGLSVVHAQRPPIAQAGLDELNGFLDVVAHNMTVLAEHGRETLDIRLSLNLVEVGRAEFGPRLREWLENALWLGLGSRGIDRQGSGLRFDYSEHPEGANNPPGLKITVHRSLNWSPRSYRAARRLELQVLRHVSLPEAHRRRLRWMVQGLVKRVRENSYPDWNVRLVVDLRISDFEPKILADGVAGEVIAAVREALPGQPEENITKFIRDHIVLYRQSNRAGKSPELFLDIEGPPHDELDSTKADPDLSLSWDKQELVSLLPAPVDPLSQEQPTEAELFSDFTRVLDVESGPRDSAAPTGVDAGGVGLLVPLLEVVGEIGLDEVVFVPLIYADGEVGTFFPLVEAEVEVVRSAFAAGAYSDSYSLVAHGRGDGIWVRRKSGGVVRLNAFGVWRLLSSLLQPGMWPVLPKVMIVSCWVDNPARGGFLGQIRQFARNADYPETLSGSKKRARVQQGNPWVEELDGEPSGPVKGGVGFDEHGIPYVDMTPPPRSNRTVPVFPLPEADGPEPERKIRRWLPSGRDVGGWSGPICLDDPSKLLESNEEGLSAFADLFAANVGLLAEQDREMPDVQVRANAATKEARAHIPGQFNLLWECLLDAVPINESAAAELELTFDRQHDYSHGSRDFAISVLDSTHLPTQSYRAACELTLPITFKEHAEALSGVDIRRSHWMVSGADIRRLQWMMEGLVQRVDANKSTVLEIRLVVGLDGLEDGLESLIVTHVNKAVRAAKPVAHDGDIESFVKSHIRFRVLVKPYYHAQLALDIIGPPHELDDVSRKRPLYLSWSKGEQSVESQADQVAAGLSRDGSPVDEGAATAGPQVIKDIQLVQLKEPLWEASSGLRVEMGTLIEWFSALSFREQQLSITQASLDELEGILDVVARNMKLLAANGRETVDVRLALNLKEPARQNFGHRLREWLETKVRLGLVSRGGNTQGSGIRIEYSERGESANNPPGFKITVNQSPFWSARSYRAARSLDLQMLWYGSLPEAHRRRLRWMVEGLVERVRENPYPGAMVRLIVDLRTTKHQLKVQVALVTHEVIEAVRVALPGESEANIRDFIRDHIAFYRQGRGYQEPGLFLDIQGPAHALDWVEADPDLSLSWNTQELVQSLPGPVVELPPDEAALFSALTTILDEEAGPSSEDDVVAGGESEQEEVDFRLSHEGGEER
ncbi:hypothetical protein [Amycolatopsis japonica]